MEPADDNKSANLGNTLKLDLSTLKDRHELVRNEAFQNGTNATESAKGPTVELLKHVVAPESNRTEAGGLGLYQLPHNTEVAAVSAAINHASINNAEDISVTNDNPRRSSNSALCSAGNISSSRSLNPPDKSKHQIIEIVPPNSSPARLEGLPRKGALSPFQKNDPRTTARGAAPGGLNDKKASSFSAPTNSPVKSRLARGVLAVDNTGTGTASITSEKALNVQRVAEYDGRAEKVVGAGSTSSSGSTTHQTERGKGRCEDAHWMQQEILKDQVCSQTSDESVEDEDDEGQSESGESDSCDADCQNTSPSERHLEREDEWQREDATEACPAVLETELDGPEEEEHLDIGELRYNMRTGKFSKAYVVRGVSGHRTLLKQRRATVGGEKGPESSWIFPWEVRPEIDVFAAAAAATAASSARRHQLLPSRRVGSAPADTNSHNYTSCPGRACGKPYAEGLYRRKQPHATHFQRRQTEEDSHGDRIISERQRESVFDCLSKMAQANEWAQMMKLDRNYRAFKTRDGKLACHVYQGKSYVKRLPVEVFMSYEYPRLRRRFMLCCPYLHVQSQAVAGANLNDTEVRMRRELELQNVLLSTIQLTHVLREQLDFLQRASIENPLPKMRQLTEEEVKLVFEKLAKFVGNNLMHIVDNQEHPYVFRLHHERVFYMSEQLLKMAGHIPRKSLILAGVCIGKFTKTRKFRLQVTALDLIARYARYKVWLKPAGDQAFVYGHHVIKRHIGRVTADMPQNAGVCICSLNNDLPLGFGVAAKSTSDIHAAETEAIAVYHMADIGEYLREEVSLL